MAEQVSGKKMRPLRHRGRLEQVVIYLGKLLRMFVYQNEWKVLPMAAIIAALVSMVIRKDFFLTMEGNLKGAFALTCVAIWNGCFNSIQVVSRERQIIKREHRSGMHVSSYVMAHMMYQALLCAFQSALTLYVCRLMGVRFPDAGLFTRWMLVDLWITMFLVTYASDMLSLLLSCLAHTTTTAMTIMPFVLIFQLVFSGGIFELPAWSQSLSRFTISNYALKAFASQADYNGAPMMTAWNMVQKMREREVGGSITVGQALDFLADKNNDAVNQLRDRQIDAAFTLGEAWDFLKSTQTFGELRNRQVDAAATLGEIISFLQTSGQLNDVRSREILTVGTVGDLFDLMADFLRDAGLSDVQLGKTFTLGELADSLHLEDVIGASRDLQLGKTMTVGELIDCLVANPDLQARRDREITLRIKLGRLVELAGEDNVRELLQFRAAEVSKKPAFEHSRTNIALQWLACAMFIAVFSLLSAVVLKFIDKDRR